MTFAPDRWERVKELFGELSELDDAQRAARLAGLPAEDDDVRAEVASLLRSADSVGDRFEDAPGARDGDALVADMRGQRVGAYEIVAEIGHGGMGTVYEARRVDEQFSKRVAVKMVAGTARTEQAIRRFRRERQLLARLEHRNIATLLDGGVTEQGQPYFVMEYVEGKPIDRWCTDGGLTVRQRLELFRQVCAAVQYAHEHLVVHRDLKPGNILVADDGTVKLLDFGVAKLLDTDVTGDDALTHTGVLPMTAAYASPEQVRGDPVSTASDIYSLGVVLYELLSGRRPFGSRKGVTALTAPTPVNPSRAITDAPTTADPNITRRMQRDLSGEVDSIVMMAMRPEVRTALSVGATVVGGHSPLPDRPARHGATRHRGVSRLEVRAPQPVCRGQRRDHHRGIARGNGVFAAAGTDGAERARSRGARDPAHRAGRPVLP